MKKVFKWLAIGILIPVVLFLLLAVALYLPPVQNWVADKVAGYASEQTGMDISVGRVKLKFPLDLAVDDFKVIKDNDSIPGVRDTIADVGQLIVDLQWRPLLDKKVEIDNLTLHRVKLNTNGFIPDVRVKGNVEQLALECHGIDLTRETVRLDQAVLDSARLDICLADTVPPDTTKSDNKWRIRVDQLQLKRTDVTVHMPGDSLSVQAYLAEANASGGDVDLDKGTYKVGNVKIERGRVAYDKPHEKPVAGLDTNHILVSDINAEVDSIVYDAPNVALDVKSCAFKEKSGIQVDDFSGRVAMDDNRLSLPEFNLQTPDSRITASVEMDLDTFDERAPGKLAVDIDGHLGKQDIMRFMGDMPSDFVRKWPNQPLAVQGKVRGNMQRAEFYGLNVSLPTAMQLKTTGYVENLSQPSSLKADLSIKGRTDNLDFVKALMPDEVKREVNIPRGIALDGRFKANGNQYGADFLATEGGGQAKVNMALDSRLMKYSATVDARQFPIQHFLPKMGLSPVSAYIEADGQGTDFFDPATTLRAKARVDRLTYGGYNLAGTSAEATLNKGHLVADIDSRSGMLDGKISFDALLNTKKLQGTFACDLAQADLYQLRIADTPLSVSGCAHVDIDSDLKDFYKVKGSLSGVSVYFKDTYYRPDDMEVDLLTRRDTTYAHIDSGDFRLDMNGRGGYEKLLYQANHFYDELSRQLDDKHFNQQRLRDQLPDASLSLTSGNNNFFANLLQEQGYAFGDLDVQLASSHIDGLNGHVALDKLEVDSVVIDMARFSVVTDSTGFKYNGQVRNLPDNPLYCFNALFDGAILEQGAQVNAKVYDKDDKLGFDIGAVAAIQPGGVRVALADNHPVIGYMPFTANDDNYVFYGDDHRLSANLSLKADDGTSLQLYTDDKNTDALQDLTLSIHKLDLGRLMTTLPFLPGVKGLAEGDFHIVQTDDDLTVSSTLNVASLAYEGMPMGNLGADFVYMPNDDGSHHVDGVVFSEGEEVASIVGTYHPEGEGVLDANMHLDHLPLATVNGFIPDQLIGFSGAATGDLSVKGPMNQLDVNGQVTMDTTHVYSMPYGFDFRAADTPVRIVGSHLLFEQFKLYSPNNSEMLINGDYDFSNLDDMRLNLRLAARNFQLINAKENIKSEAFGKAYVDFFARVDGPLDMLSMQGRMSVLGSTDMTYVLRDSPLTVDTRMDELVRFVDLNDTVEHVVRRPAPSGFNMDLSIHVDESAHIKCDLNADHTNYIDLMGGGDLRMKYNRVDDLRLTGRYTLSNGEMKYSLPIIPLKTFEIQDGSYIEFNGDAMDPTLHITALERRKATVDDEAGSTRSVDFDCGVVITQTLNNMGLEFTIDAPEDMTIGSELATMTKEERAKVAVTMLTTGMYLADGNTSGFTMNGALSSFLQSEINQITGNALRSLDLSVGVDNATDASGAMHTDYSFKFAKRLWNNRLRIVVGGKVSTGNEVESQNQSIFTNVTMEYRLSPTSNKYLKLFYDRDSYDWLEGEIGEYGGGFLWRRKLQHFKDIFNFKNENLMTPIRVRKDSVATDTLRRDSVNKDAAK